TEACDSIFPRTSERVKVYLQKYPADPITKEKPLAEYDLVENINRGALIWYYVGHGASDLISSEKLFTVASSMKKLSNAGRNGLFWAASCNVGKFDDPSIEGLCVKLLTERDKGTVVSVGASRKSYAGFGYNDGLLYEFTKALFRTKKSLSVGEALMEAKIQKGGSNSSHYNLLGDPALKLYPEAGSVSIDPASLPDSLNVLNRYTATGSVSGMQTGDVYIRLKEADMKEMVSYGTFSGGQAGMNIVRPGRSVVTGASSLVNGAFSVSLLIPKDAPVGMSGVSASCFAASNGIISAKTIDTIKIGEYTGTGTIRGDGKGPAIRFYLSNNVPISGTEIPNSMPVSGSATVNRKTTLTIEIEDIDGLRLNSVGPNEALYFEVPGLSGRRYIESVKDVSGRPSSGYFSVRLDELFGSTSKNPAGEKLQFRVFAMDNFDNSTSGLLTLNFQSDSALGLNREQVYPYPNPFTKETRIVWSTILPADVTVNIYTQNGSLIRVLKSIGVTGAYDPNANSLWDGRDERGNKMARGVYFYTVHIKGSTVAGTANASKEDVLRGAMLRE
ncbi:MAG: hypothetical protein JNL74_16100, partial [Fibrobacteres bacterium]|nr:hypothetical protein [Fibrobacterota bacterium]